MKDGEDLEKAQSNTNDTHDRYLDLLQDIRTSKEEMIEDKGRLEDLINASNMLFKKIKTSSELKLDAKITAISTRLTCSRMEKDFASSGITSKEIAELFTNDLLDDFYKYAMSCSLAVKFLDSLSFEQKEDMSKSRPRMERSRLVVSEVEIPKSISTAEEDIEGLEILSRIEEAIRKKGRREYFSCVIDLNSFSKTIENMFYLSLAIRSGVATLEFSESIMYVCPFKPSAKSFSANLTLEISYDEYLKLIERMKMDMK